MGRPLGSCPLCTLTLLTPQITCAPEGAHSGPSPGGRVLGHREVTAHAAPNEEKGDLLTT